MTIFFHLVNHRQGILNASRRSFSRQSVPSLSEVKRTLVLGEICLRLPLLTTQSHGDPCVENCRCLHLNQPVFLSMYEVCCFPFVTSLCVNFCSEIHDPALKFRLVREFLLMHLRGEISQNCRALSTSPKTQGMVSRRQDTFHCLDLLSCSSLRTR